jgi:S-adenosylmethionine decarboxylase
MNFLGTHLLAEFYGCNRDVLNDEKKISEIMTCAALVSGSTVIRPFFHKFSPHGVSGVIIIAESHIAVHTWPEYGFAALDIFSCSNLNFSETLKYIMSHSEAGRHAILSIKRGIDADSPSGSPLKYPEPERIYL